MNCVSSFKCDLNIYVMNSALLSVSSIVFVPCFPNPLGVGMA